VRKQSNLRDALLCFGLALLTLTLVGLAQNYLPYSESRDTITDALSMPGGFIGGLFYPEGIHTGAGAPAWGYIAYFANVVFYFALWFGGIRVVRLVQRRDK